MRMVMFLQLAGVLHAGLLCAGIMMPRVVEMKSHVAKLPQFLRDLFWTYYVFIGGCIVGFGGVTFFYAQELAAGDALGRAVADGLLAGGVLPVVKHVPGHGRAGADSHLDLPVVDTGAAELETTDFVPFRALADLPAAMTAHVVFSAIDVGAPASVSRIVTQTIIR